MQSSILTDIWPSRVARKPLLKPVLLSLAALFLFCLPLSQIVLAFSGIRHPAVSLSLLLIIATVCFGGWEIARQNRVSVTTTTGWMAIGTLLLCLPSFYLHADTSAALWYAGGALLVLLLFFTLQQFSFNHFQRQYLLLLPLLAGWLVALPILIASIIPSLSDILSAGIRRDTAAIILMTSMTLSAYLLARTKVYKRNWLPVHGVLIATPLVMVFALLQMHSAWLVTVILALILFAQPFLFRYCRKLHHGLWNLSVMSGFVLVWLYQGLPEAALLSPRYSESVQAVITQTWQLLSSAQFEGVGLGQLATAQLLYGVGHQDVLPVIAPYPSWLLAMLTQGGIAYWLGFGVLFAVTFKRLTEAPNGTRMMLFAILLPSLIGMSLTAYTAVNPVLAVLFIVLLYWVDNLTARYQRVAFAYGRTLRLATYAVLTLSTLTVFSSVYLGEQALRTHQIRGIKLAQYELHPWWHSFYRDEIGKRAFFDSVEKRDSQAQEAYLRDQIRLLARKPSADKYQTLIELAVLTDNRAIARQISEEAALLFPDQRFEPSFTLPQ